MCACGGDVSDRRWWEASFSAPLARRRAHAPAGRAYTRYSRWLPSHSDCDDTTTTADRRSLTRMHARGVCVYVCTREPCIPTLYIRSARIHARVSRITHIVAFARSLVRSVSLFSYGRAKEERAQQKRANARARGGRRRPSDWAGEDHTPPPALCCVVVVIISRDCTDARASFGPGRDYESLVPR